MADHRNRWFAGIVPGIAFRDTSSPHSSILFRQEGAILPGPIVSCLRVTRSKVRSAFDPDLKRLTPAAGITLRCATYCCAGARRRTSSKKFCTNGMRGAGGQLEIVVRIWIGFA
jgi:hypothetical protein